MEEVEAKADCIRVDLDEGVVGIDDMEVVAAGDGAPICGDDAVVFSVEQMSEKRDGGTAAHDDHGFDGCRWGGQVGGCAAGAEIATGGSEKAGEERGIAEVVDDFAALVGRGEHGEASGWREAVGDEGAGKNAAEGMGEPEGIPARGFAFDERAEKVDELGDRLPGGGVGDVEGGEAGGVEAAGEWFHGMAAAPESMEEDDERAMVFPACGAVPGEGRDEHFHAFGPGGGVAHKGGRYGIWRILQWS